MALRNLIKLCTLPFWGMKKPLGYATCSGKKIMDRFGISTGQCISVGIKQWSLKR